MLYYYLVATATVKALRDAAHDPGRADYYYYIYFSRSSCVSRRRRRSAVYYTAK